MPVNQLHKICQSDEQREHLDMLFANKPPGWDWKKSLSNFPQILRKEREDLLALFQHSTARYNEVQKILYLKPLFLNRDFRGFDTITQRKILNILLADQDVLFTGNDDIYRLRIINRENIEAWNKRAREPKYRRICYDTLPIWNVAKMGEKEKKLYTLYTSILEKLSLLAGEEHQNIDSYIDTVTRGGKMSPEEKRILLQQKVPDHAEQITLKICNAFFDTVLPNYIDKLELISLDWYKPGYIDFSMYEEQAKLFANYKARLSRLENLADGFESTIQSALQLSMTEFIDDLCMQGGTSNCNDNVNKIGKTIEVFFDLREDDAGPLTVNPKNILGDRILYILNRQDVPLEHKPALITYMTIYFDRNVSVTGNYESLHNRKGPFYSQRCGIPKQRMAQLALLDQLCDMFSLGKEARLQNFKEFLVWLGKQTRI